MSLDTPPRSQKSLRLLIFRDGAQAFNPCKFTASGDELYATTQGSDGNFHHFSVHSDGRVHYRMEKKSVHLMRSAAVSGFGSWWHGLSFRFNSGPEDSLKPKPVVPARDVLRMDVPPNHVLQVDLFFQKRFADEPLPLDNEASRPVWERKLRSGGRILMLMSIGPMDHEDAKFQAYVRDDLRITLDKPTNYYSAEAYNIPDATGDNIVRVANAGPCTYRWNQTHTFEKVAMQPFTVDLAPTRSILRAPNGAPVGTVMLSGCSGISVSSQVDRDIEFDAGTIILELFTEGLIRGSSFLLKPMYLETFMKVSGVEKRRIFRLRGSFDGEALNLNLGKHSMGVTVRYEGRPSAIERLSVGFPRDDVNLSASLATPMTVLRIAGTLGRYLP